MTDSNVILPIRITVFFCDREERERERESEREGGEKKRVREEIINKGSVCVVLKKLKVMTQTTIKENQTHRISSTRKHKIAKNKTTSLKNSSMATHSS